MAEKGSLVLFVYTARMAIPIKHAYISIWKPKTKELLGFRVTNEQGQTALFEMPTPDIGLSLSPQSEDAPYQTPFTLLDVQVDHAAYQSVRIENVQLFPGRESVQMVNLIPLGENANQAERTVNYPISFQAL